MTATVIVTHTVSSYGVKKAQKYRTHLPLACSNNSARDQCLFLVPPFAKGDWFQTQNDTYWQQQIPTEGYLSGEKKTTEKQTLQCFFTCFTILKSTLKTFSYFPGTSSPFFHSNVLLFRVQKNCYSISSYHSASESPSVVSTDGKVGRSLSPSFF